MSQNAHSASLPPWTWIAPLAALALLAAKFAHVIPADAAWVLGLAALLLGAAVFAGVHHAEVLAERIGEPYGSIVLAAAVTVIEVALIASIMLSAADGAPAVARDTVFAAIMIILNGLVGICLLIGGIRHHEQGFLTHGASGALGVLGTLATLVLILPNYTMSVPGPFYAPSQLAFVAIVSLALYGLFLFVQTVRHRDYFVATAHDPNEHEVPSGKVALLSAGLLFLSLVGVILLAKTLSPAIGAGVAAAGLPPAFLGVVIAGIVLLPESVAALRAAAANRLQTSLNLALGSALATIGLTIPVVAALSFAIDTPLRLGLEDEHIVLLVLSLFTSTLTLATGRTTVLQGGVHLVIFGAFLTISAVP